MQHYQFFPKTPQVDPQTIELVLQSLHMEKCEWQMKLEEVNTEINRLLKQESIQSPHKAPEILNGTMRQEQQGFRVKAEKALNNVTLCIDGLYNLKNALPLTNDQQKALLNHPSINDDALLHDRIQQAITTDNNDHSLKH